MIKLFKMNENERIRHPPDEQAWETGDEEDFDDDELAFYGIVVKKGRPPKCPYDKNGNYVPRSKR